jgi:hypothetical protein
MSPNFDISLTSVSASAENYSSGSSQVAQPRRAGILPTVNADASLDGQELQPYRVTISEEALRKAGLLKDEVQSDKTGAPAEKNNADDKKSSSKSNTQEARELESLQRTDREVRAHEQAHIIAGGSLVRGAASFGYTTGPDGKLYAVNGEVSIDSSPVQDDPEATISKMMRVVAAALAPARPSGQDRSVASAAMKTQMEAQQELTQTQLEKMQGNTQSEQSTPANNTSDAKKSETEVKSSDNSDAFKASASNTTKTDNEKQFAFQTKSINIQA